MDFLKIKAEKETEKIIKWIREIFKNENKKKAIVAVSGGVDSTTSLMLLTKALGKENVLSLEMPYKQSMKKAKIAINQADLAKKNRLKINLNKTVDELVSKLKVKDKIRKGNMIARVRMICLFDMAKKHQALVGGTENKSEKLLGYFTRFGDQASDFEPLAHLFKVEVYQVAFYLKVDKSIINQKPSAGLWPGQTDEKELGFSYQKADNVLYWHQKGLSQEKIIKKGLNKKLVNKIINRVEKMDFKQRVPYYIK